VGQAQNELTLTGSIVELDRLRHTPAGLPVLSFRIAHRSEQAEAGQPRQVEVELGAVALGQTAVLLAQARPGEHIKATGFLAAKSLRSRQPVLHVERIEFVEGLNHGI
jgi:primosomal replication protein N